MATEEEIYKIIARVEGTEKIQALEKELKRAETNLKNFLDIDATQARNWAGEIARLNKEIAATDKAIRAAGGGTRNSAYAFLEFSRAAEDAQYGLAGVVNNIPGIITALGGGAGLVGAISLASVAINQLVKHAGDLGTLFGKSAVKTQAEEIEDLGKKASKTADELARLVQLENRRDSAKAQQGKTDDQQQRAGAVNDTIRNAPYQAAREAVGQVMGDVFRKNAPQDLVDQSKQADRDAQLARERLRGGGGFDPLGLNKGAVDKADGLRQKLEDDYNQKITDYLGDLANDRTKLLGFIDRLKEQRKQAAEGGASADELDRRDSTIRSLQQAAKTPEQLKAEERKAREDDRTNTLMDHEEQKYQKGLDADEFYRQRDAEVASRQAAFEDQGRAAEEDRMVGLLGGGNLGRRAAAGTLTRQDVAGALIGQGYTPMDAWNKGEAIHGKLKARGDAEAGDRAARDGTDIATARFRIGRDADRETFGKIRDAQQGVFDAFAGAQEPRRMSRVIDSAGLADSIQSAVGGDHDTGKQQLEQLRKANENLNRVVEALGGRGPVLAR